MDQASYLLTLYKDLPLYKDEECLQMVSTDSLEYRFSNLQILTEYTISVCTVLPGGNQSMPVLSTIYTGNKINQNILWKNTITT